MSAPLLSNESERLAELRSYAVLDTPPEVVFERLTGLVAQVFEVPIVLVSLVDTERQWFKSCFGLDVRQTDRKLSFCAHAILVPEVMVVPDTLADPRFVDNGLVTGPPYIRFYAGAPLRTSSGHRLGTLCVIDRAPREFGADQCEMLEVFAEMVVDRLELRRTLRTLRESEATLLQSEATLRESEATLRQSEATLRESEANLRHTLREKSQLARAVSSLASGVMLTDPHLPDNPITFANAGFYATTGYTPEEAVGRNPRFLQGTETDADMVQKMREAVEERRVFQGVLLNYRKDGTPFSNSLTIGPVFDEGGQLVNFIGLQNDVTEREQSRRLLEEWVGQRSEELAQSQVEMLGRLARAAEYRDDDTGQHTRRVARTAALTARALGWSEERVHMIQQAAPLHDVGKIAISDLLLLKPGRLTQDEFELMKSHVRVGASILANGHSEVIQMAERIAGSHHERWDGTGYPQGLTGEQIPIEGRIVAIADVFDALTHERPYKDAWSVADTLAELTCQSRRQFDPRVVDAFLTLPHADLV